MIKHAMNRHAMIKHDFGYGQGEGAGEGYDARATLNAHGCVYFDEDGVFYAVGEAHGQGSENQTMEDCSGDAHGAGIGDGTEEQDQLYAKSLNLFGID